MEEESGIYIGEGLAPNRFDAFTVPPPTPPIVIWVRHGNDAHRNILPQRLLKEEAGAARMDIFGNNIDAGHGRIVVAKPVLEGNGRPICPVPIHHS